MAIDPSRQARRGASLIPGAQGRLAGLRKRYRPVAVALGLLTGAVVLGGCDEPTFGAFRGATTQGTDEFKLWVGLVIAGLVVAVIVWALIFWAMFRYRRRDDSIPKQFHEHIPLEIVYTVLPVLIVAAIFYFTVVTENEEDAVSHPAEIVQVHGFQWGWKFSYANGAHVSQGINIQTQAEPKLLAQPATSKEYPQLVLPVGEETEIVLTSDDVIHGFYIPEFNYSRYAQPGVVNTLPITPTKIGTYRGQCTQYCGLYHSEMLFSVKVVSQSQFKQWLASHSGSASQSGVAS